MSVALVGDSYVRRLGEFAIRRATPDLGLIHDDVRFFGIGGSSLFGRKRVQPSLDAALALPNLSVLFLAVGSNDVGRASSERIVTALLSLAEYAFCAHPDVIVIIGQLHFRASQPSESFNNTVAFLNKRLRHTILGLGNPRLHYASSRGLYKPPASLYSDGTHFTDAGERLLLRGVRGAVCRARKALLQASLDKGTVFTNLISRLRAVAPVRRMPLFSA